MITEGTVLGQRYVIEACLGRGGMGAVYRARHSEVGRPFAIKVLPPSLCDNAVLVARFRREAELAGRLRHDNVVAVVDMGVTDDGEHYLVMEYAPGVPLDTLLARGPMAEARVLELGKQLCDGLQHAHDAGLIHRDFKPDNVIVEQRSGGREVARIVDFGVAILRDDARDVDGERLTTTGIVVGTPHYMAPEQARGGAVDHRIDLFSLGLTLYELLAGKPPFDGTGVDVARANVSLATPPMGIRAPGVHVEPALEALVRRLLSKDPDDRLPTARSVRELLDLYGRDRESAAALLGVRARPRQRLVEPAPAPAPEPEPESEEPPPRRSRRPLVVAALIGAGVFGAGIYAAMKQPPPRTAQVVVEAPAAPAPTSANAPATDEAPAAPEAPSTPEARETQAAARPLEAPTRPPALPPPRPAPTPRAARSPAPGVESRAPAPTVVASANTTDQVIDLYQRVGRELRAYSQIHHDDAQELWARYRWIRLHDAMTRPDKRHETIQILERLHAQVSDSRRK